MRGQEGEERRVEVSWRSGKKKGWGGRCPKEARGEEKPRENERHKKRHPESLWTLSAIPSASQCAPPLQGPSAGRLPTPTLCVHTALAKAAASQPLAPHSPITPLFQNLHTRCRCQLELSGPPRMQ